MNIDALIQAMMPQTHLYSPSLSRSINGGLDPMKYVDQHQPETARQPQQQLMQMNATPLIGMGPASAGLDQVDPYGAMPNRVGPRHVTDEVIPLPHPEMPLSPGIHDEPYNPHGRGGTHDMPTVARGYGPNNAPSGMHPEEQAQEQFIQMLLDALRR